MTDIQERRAEGAGRVRVETLVEVCGNEPGIPAFEAEAVDVSARGMHLRTAYLPDNGAPLVCRFEEGGREIVVEGRVAWRREGGRGGEFGVEFTALDSGSVGALRELCDSAASPAGAQEAASAAKAEVGARVRLHIDGLGSPMKARVRESGASNVQVGSNLEFLKVGRRLEVEDLELGGRRQAQIDSVSVAVDPQTRVPQLVVQLRFADRVDNTPEPSVMALDDSGARAKGFTIPASAVTTDGPPATQDGGTADSDSNDEREAEAMRGKVAEVAASAGDAAKIAGLAVARLSASAARGVGGLFSGAGRRMRSFSRKNETAPPRRTTAPAPNPARTGEGPKLRPQSQAAPDSDTATPTIARLPKKKLMMGAGGAVLFCSLAALVLHHSASPPGAQTASSPAIASVAPPSTGAPLTTTTEASLPTTGVTTANVPLFGPTPMATMEPAPLAPPPGAPASIEAAEKADAQANATGAPLAASATDEAFSEDDGDDDKNAAQKSGSERDASPKGNLTKAEARTSRAAKRAGHDDDGGATKTKTNAARTDTKPWGQGKLHSPTIYRLRLDAGGGKLEGVVLPTGFTVLVPNHKVMETGSGIAKRDTRITSVRTINRNAGAEVAFHFRDAIPAYRVRLRHDYIEFLIGEAQSDKPKPAHDAGTKRDAKAAAHAKPHRG